MGLNMRNIFGQSNNNKDIETEETEYENEEQEGEEEEEEYEESGKAIEIRVVRPKKFEEVPQIADYLLNGRLVFLNLESTDKVNSRRILDYLLGTIYILKGDLKPVSSTAFIIGPSGVDITGAFLTESIKREDKDSSAAQSEGGFSNL